MDVSGMEIHVLCRRRVRVMTCIPDARRHKDLAYVEIFRLRVICEMSVPYFDVTATSDLITCNMTCTDDNDNSIYYPMKRIMHRVMPSNV